MSSLDATIIGACVVLCIAFVYIIWSYAKELRTSPRELWLMSVTRLLEGVAYFAINFSMALWLSIDCGLGDVQAGVYISIWSFVHGAVGLIAGPFVDVFGIRKSFLVTFFLIILSRVFMFWMTNPFLSLAVVFIPFAIGTALIEPAGYIAVKRYTTEKTAGFGYGMIYVLMNIALAGGVWGFDKAREVYGEIAGSILPVVGHLSTYQMIYFYSLGIAVICLLLVLLMRSGVEMTSGGVRVMLPEHQPGTFGEIVCGTFQKAVTDIVATLISVIKDSYFWRYMLIITITLFVRWPFFHLLYTFPKYGIRVLGEGAKVGTIYGVLNPVLIVFAVPLFAALLKRFSSYKVLLAGASVSSLALFIAAIPGPYFSFMTDSVLGEIVFIKWLGLAENMMVLMTSPPSASYWPLLFLITFWSLGESVWYPRYLQVLTGLAPKGNEGTYIALVGLPTFTSPLIVGPMSGLLLRTYTPVINVVGTAGQTIQVVGDLSHHYMVWVWIGGLAMITPIGLWFCRKIYNTMTEEKACKEAKRNEIEPQQ